MVNYNHLFNFNSAAMPEFDPLTPHDHRIGHFDGFTGDILEWPGVDSCLFDCPTPDLDTDLPPLERARVEEGFKSLTIGENVNSNYSMTPDQHLDLDLKALDFTDEDDTNRWVDSCLNFSQTSDQPCTVEATGSIVDAMEICSKQPSTSLPQTVNDVALSSKSPPPPIAMQLILDSDAQGKKNKRLCLMGMKRYGKGNRRSIAGEVVKTKTDIQIGSRRRHPQKHSLSLRCKSNTGGTTKQRKSIPYDITTLCVFHNKFIYSAE